MGQGKQQVTTHRVGLALMLVLAVALGACTPNQVEKSRGEALKQFETLVRWSQWDAAVDFIDPEYLVEHPITRLDMDRLRLFRVTAYTVRSTGVYDEGMTTRQVVEIKLYNTHQGVERALTYNEEWRYNETTKRWQMHNGLPDPTKRY